MLPPSKNCKRARSLANGGGGGIVYLARLRLAMVDEQDSVGMGCFLDLVCFLEYGDATLYTREIEEDVVHYLLASLTKDGLRFACKVNFSRYIERK